MRKLYLFLFLTFPFLAQTQITLTADDMPQVGDVVSTVDCDFPMSLTVGNSGANQTYDFSMVTPIDTTTTSYVSPAGTPGASEFPDATLASEDDGDFFYLQQTSDAILQLGFYRDTSQNSSGQYVAFPFNPTQKVFEIPTTFNTSFTDMSGFSVTGEDNSTGYADSLRNTTTFNSDVLIDGYGTVITPNGSFTTLRELRITTITSLTEAYVFGMWTTVFNTSSTDTSYNWYADNSKGPLASASIENGMITDFSYSTQEVVVAAPMANFSSSNQGGGVVDFTDASSNSPTSWLWDFGDGNTSTQQNPTHTYTAPGTYNVCLTVTNSAGSDMVCVNEEVVFVPVAAFTSSSTQGVVDFTDASTNSPTSWLWDFGDGNTSTDQNPQHTYTASGMYTVCLTVTNSAGSNTVCNTVDVTITSIDDLENKINVEVFPNPISAILNVRLENTNHEMLDFQLVNALGQTVLMQRVTTNGSYSFDVKKLPTGVYHYIFRDENKVIRNRGSLLKNDF